MSCETKLCKKCAQELPLSEFSRHGSTKDRLFPECKACSRERQRANRARNPSKHKASGLKSKLKTRYDLTLEEFNSMLEQQNGKCKICQPDSPGHQGRFYVDHNHTTGRVRGLLCRDCNTMLGMAKDSPALLLSAPHYLISEGHYGTSQ